MQTHTDTTPAPRTPGRRHARRCHVPIRALPSQGRDLIASKDETDRDLYSTGGLAYTPLAIQRAERLVRSKLEQGERIVVGRVENIQGGFEAVSAESEILTDADVPDVDR